jgi:hypothetical protein
MLLLDLSPLIHGLEKGKMHGDSARTHEKLPSIVKQKATECYAPDKKPSTAENFSIKFSRRVKNATPAATSSPVALMT